jgi:uncharacterized protein (TIGR00251 family)
MRLSELLGSELMRGKFWSRSPLPATHVPVTPGTSIRVRLQPRASRNEIVGERDGVLLVRVTAPPSEGKANDALCKLLAKRAGVGRTRVSLLRGTGSRDKLVQVEGLAPDELQTLLGL